MQMNRNVLPLPQHAEERAQDFVGREWVLGEISEWLDAGSKRYLLITGEPGSGKTALAAWLAGAGPVPKDADAAARLARIRAGWDAVHFCVARGQEGTVDPSKFARSLAGQLIQREDAFAEAVIDGVAPEVNIHLEARENWGNMIGLKLDRLIFGQQSSQDIYNRAVREPLENLARVHPKLTVLILVDALDEALTAEEVNIVTLLAGSGDLPQSVRFLITSRNEARVVDQFDNVKRVDLSVPDAQHSGATKDDLKTYISTRLTKDKRLLGPPLEGARLQDQLVMQADGNFLYAKWILDEWAKRPQVPADIAALPRGLNGLYRTFLDRLVPQAAQRFNDIWGEQYAPFFGCLTVATPAAPETILPRWLGWTPAQLNVHVEEVGQVIEYAADLPEEDRGYRLYHRSIADFLSAYRYEDDDGSRTNRYYVEPTRQHHRIASYYLERIRDPNIWAGDWEKSDSYGLRELVGHLTARLDPADDGYGAMIEDLYEVALDARFHAAQRQRLGGIYETLADLRDTLDVALDRADGHDFLQALRCVAAFRGITRSEGLSRAVFGAVAAGDFAMALQKTTHYLSGSGSGGSWNQVLKLYLAWESAESGEMDEVRQAVAQSDHLVSGAVEGLGEALLTRTAEALARQAGDPRLWLAEFGRADDAERLLTAYSVAASVSPDEVRRVSSAVEPQIVDLERLNVDVWTEAGSDGVLNDEGPAPLMDPESSAELAWSLREDLHRIAASPAGQELIERALVPILANPYPRYRDKALGAVGAAILGVPDEAWVRQRLQAVLRAGLDDEGVTFTFDLPAIGLAEWERRGRSAPQLASYLETAAACHDVWGTRTRALSAQAAASYHLGDVGRAFSLLQEASAEPTQYAGYGVIASLALVDRCHEFGDPGRAELSMWGVHGNQSLYAMAHDFAARVYDPDFRQERLDLVDQHRRWTHDPTPDPKLLQTKLSAIADQDERAAYQNHVSARWASPLENAVSGLKALVSSALFDSTTLDAVLGRLLAAHGRDIEDRHLEVILQLIVTDFTSGSPWRLGQWR